MSEDTGSGNSGPNIVIIAVVAVVLVAGIAIWATTRHPSAPMRSGTTVSGSATVGSKDGDVKVKVSPDSVTVEAH